MPTSIDAPDRSRPLAYPGRGGLAGLSAGQRLGIAAILAALLWLAVWWAL